jgi:hypothetical protein
MYLFLGFIFLVLFYLLWRSKEGLSNNTTVGQQINRQTADIQLLANNLSSVNITQDALDALQTCVDNNVENTSNLQTLLEQQKAQSMAYPEN